MGMFDGNVVKVGAEDVKFKRAKYPFLTSDDCWEYVTHLYLALGMKPKEIRKKLRPLVAKPFTLQSLTVFINRRGLPAARRRIEAELKEKEKRARKHAIKLARKSARCKALSEGMVAEAAADKVISRAEKGAEKHFSRMEKLIDKAHAPLEVMEVTPKNVGDFLSDTDKFDKVARRTFNMDNRDVLDPHKHGLAVLLNLNTIVQANQEKEASGRVVS